MNGVIVLNKEKNNILTKIKNSYAIRYIKKTFSIICTLILILLIVVGAFMFYFNLKGKKMEKMGEKYVPPFGLYTIVSGSMEPNVKVYDVIIAKDVNDLSSIRVGDIITFVSTWDLSLGKTVTHRVISISKTSAGDYQFTTKGDANDVADGAIVTQENLIGKVVFRIPQLGRIQFLLATKAGWLIIVFVPAIIIILLDIIRIIKLQSLREKLKNIKAYRKEDSKEIS